MKRLLAGALALLSFAALAATTTPPSLINPAGSTSGQAILSTGPTTAPAWGTVTLGGISGTLAIANGGTGATTAAAARTALGVPGLTGNNTFSGSQTIAAATPLLGLNDTSGAGLAEVVYYNSGTPTWRAAASSANNALTFGRYVSGTFTDVPLLLSNSTGVATFTQRPVFGAATPWDSANLNLAAPPAIGGTTPAAGAFTTLSVTGLLTVSSLNGIAGTPTNNNANAGSVGEYPSPTNLTSVAMTSGTAANVSSAALTAGDWDVQCDVGYAPAGTTTMTGMIASVSTTTNTHSFTLGDLTAIQGISTAAGSSQFVSTPVVRKSLASTTTVYCVASAGFNVSTLAASGFLRARRVR